MLEPMSPLQRVPVAPGDYRVACSRDDFTCRYVNVKARRCTKRGLPVVPIDMLRNCLPGKAQWLAQHGYEVPSDWRKKKK